jgi:hypothetical protein
MAYPVTKFLPPRLTSAILSGEYARNSNMSTAELAKDLIKESLLYKEFLAEREEILRHKWFESEKAGQDVGFEKALLDWIVKHRSAWRAERQKEIQRQNN